MTPAERSIWERFQHETGRRGEPQDVIAFGDDSELTDALAALVLAGRKRATCALARWHEIGAARMPCVGDLSLVLDGAGRARCVVETTSVIVQPVIDVDDDFAREEGEGDGSRAGWLAAHRAFFQREAEREGFAYDDRLPAVFHRFHVIWRAEP